MAERIPNPSEHLLNVNRRELLGTAVGIGATGLLPNVMPLEAAIVDPAQSLSPPFKPILNVSAATACRLLEIECRNELRREVSLPLLEISKEWRRLKNLEAAQEFANFSERFRNRVQEKVLARIRRQLGQPDWKPQGMLSGGGMAFESEVSRNLARVYERVGKCG